MDKLISEIGDVAQSVELARIFIHSMKEDINKMNYANAVKNHAKFSSIIQDLNKKMVQLHKTVEELESLTNGLQK